MEHADAVIEVFADSRTSTVYARERGTGRQRDTRREREETDEVPSIERKCYHSLLLQIERHCSAGLLKERHLSADHQGLRDTPDLEPEVQLQALAGSELKAFSFERPEAVLRDN